MIIMKPDELQKWRCINGYSQSQLAKALGVDVMTVSRWERGIRHKIPPFLHLALRWVEKEGGESAKKRATKTKMKKKGR
jgi:transcriptional regulator with XRE-family HTH domain